MSPMGVRWAQGAAGVHGALGGSAAESGGAAGGKQGAERGWGCCRGVMGTEGRPVLPVGCRCWGAAGAAQCSGWGCLVLHGGAAGGVHMPPVGCPSSGWGAHAARGVHVLPEAVHVLPGRGGARCCPGGARCHLRGAGPGPARPAAAWRYRGGPAAPGGVRSSVGVPGAAGGAAGRCGRGSPPGPGVPPPPPLCPMQVPGCCGAGAARQPPHVVGAAPANESACF